jgi:hypothetical protein
MKSLSNDEILKLTWYFMEVAKVGRPGEIFMDSTQQRWLTYLAHQGILEVSDVGVGLGISSLTVKGDRLLAEFNTFNLWKRHVGPFILRGEDIAYTSIDGRRWYKIVWRCITGVWFWLLRRLGLD